MTVADTNARAALMRLREVLAERRSMVAILANKADPQNPLDGAVVTLDEVVLPEIDNMIAALPADEAACRNCGHDRNTHRAADGGGCPGDFNEASWARDLVAELREKVADLQDEVAHWMNAQPINCPPEHAELREKLRVEQERHGVLIDDVQKQMRIVAKERERAEKAEAKLAVLLQHIDAMPNPHRDPMRHYYNQMQAWKDEARGSA